jgi:hypothetical protein
VSSDTNAGFIHAFRNFTIKNGSINLLYTGSISDAGNVLGFGGRDVPVSGSPLPTIFDSLLPVPMGNITVQNIRLSTNNYQGSGIIMYGGLQGVWMDNVWIDGAGVAFAGISYEFGWATNQSSQSLRQTSHMHNAHFNNIYITNMGNTGTPFAQYGIRLGGSYNCFLTNIYVNGCYCGVESDPASALFYNPWVGVDDVGGKRTVTLRNIVVENCSQKAINMIGAALASGGYLGTANGGPIAPTTYALQCDLVDYSLDGFAVAGTANDYGVTCSAGRAEIRNGFTTGFQRGIVMTADCTLFAIKNCKVISSSGIGVQIGGAPIVPWGTQRLSVGTIDDACFIAGNGAAGIAAQYTASLLIEYIRIGYETAHDGISETTQTNAVDIDSTCTGVICNKVYVGGTSGGNVAYAQVGTTAAQGCEISSPQGIVTFSGNWNGVLRSLTNIPNFSYATPGTLSVAYTTQAFDYIVKGGVCYFSLELVCVPTNGTASGAVQITQFPVPRNTTIGSLPTCSLEFSGINKTGGFSQLTPYVNVSGGATYLQIGCSGMNVASADLAVGDVPSGGTVKLFCSGSYFV